jgi:hypothetical protein
MRGKEETASLSQPEGDKKGAALAFGAALSSRINIKASLIGKL